MNVLTSIPWSTIVGIVALVPMFVGLRGFYLDAKTASKAGQPPKFAKIFVAIAAVNNFAFFVWGAADPETDWIKIAYPLAANPLLGVILWQHFVNPSPSRATKGFVVLAVMALFVGLWLLTSQGPEVAEKLESVGKWGFALLLALGRVIQIFAGYLRPKKRATLWYWGSQVTGRGLWIVYHLLREETVGIGGQAAALLLSLVIALQELGYFWSGKGTKCLRGRWGRCLRFWLT